MEPGDVASQFMAASRDEEVYVACEAGDLIGVASLYRPGDFIHYLFVDRDRRCSGVGADLLAVVGSLADGPVSLKVDAENMRARAFYEREGMIAFEQGRDPDGACWLRMGRADSRPGRRGTGRRP